MRCRDISMEGTTADERLLDSRSLTAFSSTSTSSAASLSSSSPSCASPATLSALAASSWSSSSGLPRSSTQNSRAQPHSASHSSRSDMNSSAVPLSSSLCDAPMKRPRCHSPPLSSLPATVSHLSEHSSVAGNPPLSVSSSTAVAASGARSQASVACTTTSVSSDGMLVDLSPLIFFELSDELFSLSLSLSGTL
jgi:hypothetical protein